MGLITKFSLLIKILSASNFDGVAISGNTGLEHESSSYFPKWKNFDSVVFQFQASKNEQKYLLLYRGSTKKAHFQKI